MILLLKRFSTTLEQRLFRNKANREATRKWQMEQSIKAGPEVLSQHGLYISKQKGGINGVKSTYGWGSSHAFDARSKGFEFAGYDNSRLHGYRQQQRNINLDPLAEKERLSRTVVEKNGSSTFTSREAARDYMAETHKGKNGLKQQYEDKLKNLRKESGAKIEGKAEFVKPPQAPPVYKGPKLEKPNITPKPIPAATEGSTKAAEGFLSKNMQRVGQLYKGTSRYGRAGQIAAIGGTALAAAGLGYGLVKKKKKKKNRGGED